MNLTWTNQSWIYVKHFDNTWHGFGDTVCRKHDREMVPQPKVGENERDWLYKYGKTYIRCLVRVLGLTVELGGV